jgi:hypothetical protein
LKVVRAMVEFFMVLLTYFDPLKKIHAVLGCYSFQASE